MAAAYLDHPRPIAFAHRGGAAHNLENSWPAFSCAAGLGYTYLETDARSTSDGALLAFHDATLDRVTDRTGQVSKLTYAQVRAARVGGTEPIPPRCGVPARGTVSCVTSFSGKRLLRAQRLFDRPICLAVTPAAMVGMRYAGHPGKAIAAQLAPFRGQVCPGAQDDREPRVPPVTQTGPPGARVDAFSGGRGSPVRKAYSISRRETAETGVGCSGQGES